MYKILILVLTVLLLTSYFTPDIFAKPAIKKSDTIRCTNIYPKFLKMGEENFLKRYPAYPILDKCLMLFNDLKFQEKYKLKNNVELNSLEKSKGNYKSSIKLGPQKFLTHFSIYHDDAKKEKIS